LGVALYRFAVPSGAVPVLAHEGIALLVISLPARRHQEPTGRAKLMARVFIGVDPHKLSATIEVVDEKETVLAKGRFSNRQGRVCGDAQEGDAVVGADLGRWKAALAPAVRWRSGCWPPENGWSGGSTCNNERLASP
jgi:hypothetical protein